MKTALFILAITLLMSACVTYVPPGETRTIRQTGGTITIYHEPEASK